MFKVHQNKEKSISLMDRALIDAEIHWMNSCMSFAWLVKNNPEMFKGRAYAMIPKIAHMHTTFTPDQLLQCLTEEPDLLHYQIDISEIDPYHSQPFYYIIRQCLDAVVKRHLNDIEIESKIIEYAQNKKFSKAVISYG